MSSLRMLRWAVMAVAIAIGWMFIAWVNRFHFTPALVFVMLAYFAVVMVIWNLWRVGAAIAGSGDDGGVDSFGRPLGRIDELDREKRTLLKAIKEAEFDHAMGKLSAADAEGMIKTYRARAIEVIKEMERQEVGDAGTVRERIEREVKARLLVEGKVKQQVAKADAKAEDKKQPKHKRKKGDKAEAVEAKSETDAKPAPVAVTAPPEDEPEAEDAPVAKTEAVVAKDDAPAAKVEAATAKAADDAPVAKTEAAAMAVAKTEVVAAKPADDVVTAKPAVDPDDPEHVSATEVPPPKAAKSDSKEAAS